MQRYHCLPHIACINRWYDSKQNFSLITAGMRGMQYTRHNSSHTYHYKWPTFSVSGFISLCPRSAPAMPPCQLNPCLSAYQSLLVHTAGLDRQIRAARSGRPHRLSPAPRVQVSARGLRLGPLQAAIQEDGCCAAVELTVPSNHPGN